LTTLPSKYLPRVGEALSKLPSDTESWFNDWNMLTLTLLRMIQGMYDDLQHNFPEKDLEPNESILHAHVTLMSGLTRAIWKRNLLDAFPSWEKVINSHRVWALSCTSRLIRPPTSLEPCRALETNVLALYRKFGKQEELIKHFNQIPAELHTLDQMCFLAAVGASRGEENKVLSIISESKDKRWISHDFDNPSLTMSLVEAAYNKRGAAGALSILKTIVTYYESTQVNMLAAQPDFNHMSFVFSKVAQLCARESQFQLLQEVIKMSQSFKFCFNDAAVEGILRFLEKKNLISEALEVFESWMGIVSKNATKLIPVEFKSHTGNSRVPSPKALASAVSLYFKAGKPDVADQVHKWALALHTSNAICLSSQYYTSLIANVNQHISYDKGLGVVKEMISFAIRPVPEIFGNLFFHAKKSNRDVHEDLANLLCNEEDQLKVVFDELNSFKDSKVCSGNIIAALIQEGEIEKAKELFQIDFVNKGPTSDLGTLSHFLQHFSSNGQVEEMEQFLKYVNAPSAIRRDPVICSILMRGYSISNDYRVSFALWEDYMEGGYVPNPAMQSVVLDTCGYSGNLQKLNEIVTLLEHEVWGGTQINIWTSAIEAYLRIGNVDNITRIISEVLPKKKQIPDAKFVGTLLSVNVKLNRALHGSFMRAISETFSRKELPRSAQRILRNFRIEMRYTA
jgi:pentatricopeptide repeat protein